MSDLPDGHPSDGPMTSGPQHGQRRSAVSRSEQKLAALRLALVQAKRSFHEASVRERSIRERTVGRAVWALIEQGRLEPAAIALIRDEVRPFLSPGRAAAFIGTVFELPTMPVGSAQEPVKSAASVSLAEPDNLNRPISVSISPESSTVNKRPSTPNLATVAETRTIKAPAGPPT